MLNRLRPYLGEPDERRPPDDYYEIGAKWATFYVSREVAERVVRLLRRRWPPRWIGFTDLYGSEVRVRSRLIEYVRESARTQRAAARDFHRARREEERADRPPWEDELW
jgi:hypothetical protein